MNLYTTRHNAIYENSEYLCECENVSTAESIAHRLNELTQLRAALQSAEKARDAAVAINEAARASLAETQKTVENNASLRAALASATADVARLDWLALRHVEVREPLRYGSRELFTTSPEADEEEDTKPSDLRQKVDAARKEAP